MKITELLLEISAGERARQKKAAAEEERKRQAALAQAEQEKLRARAQKKLQKATAIKSVSKQEPAQPPPATFGGVEVPQEYVFDPKYQEIEGTEDIGVYLKFYRERKNTSVFAFYSKYSTMSWEGLKSFAWDKSGPPVIELGRRFSGRRFGALLDKLVEQTSTPQFAGYVNIIITRHQLTYLDGDRFFTEMIAWLNQNYPQKGVEELSSTVYWEISET